MKYDLSDIKRLLAQHGKLDEEFFPSDLISHSSALKYTCKKLYKQGVLERKGDSNNRWGYTYQIKNQYIKWEPIPAYGDVFKIGDFITLCEMGGFIDYDGHGYLATKDKMSEVFIKPSMFTAFNPYKPHKGFTHIVWFNK